MKKPTLLILFLFFVEFAFTQEVKFGNVSKEELEEASYLNDPSAEAAVLFKSRYTYYHTNANSDELVTEIFERIKIYNKEGFEHATKGVRLFKSRSSKERLRKLKAYTYNLENGKVVKTELDKDQVFETEINYNYDEVKFTMPNVKEGSVIEFSYEVWSPFIWSIDEFKFQYEIPIKRVEAELRTPSGFNFNQTQKGYEQVNTIRTSEMDNRIGMSVDIRKFNLHNVPALKEESFVDNISNYRTGIMFELVSYNVNGHYRGFAQTWDQVAQNIGSDDDYKNQLDKTNSFNDQLDTLLANALTQEEKMKIIFKYVKDNIKWNGYDGIYFYNGLKKTMKEKEGNAADINLMLVAMLRYAKINANPVIISTKDNFIPLFPTSDRLNYVIAYAVIGDKQYFLDATDEFSDINIMPIRNYNWRGVYIDNPRSRWKLIAFEDPEPSVNIYSLNVKLNEDGEAEGKLIMRLTNHEAYKFRKNFKNANQEQYIASLESENGGIEISNYEAKNTDVFEGPVTEQYDFYAENVAEVTDNKIFIKPLLFLTENSNPFKSEKRQFPVDFQYPRKTTMRVFLMIPEGFAIESTPQSVIYQLPDNLGEFKFICNSNDKMVQLSINFDLNKSYVSPTHYDFIKEFFNQMIIKQSEQVILTKQ